MTFRDPQHVPAEAELPEEDNPSPPRPATIKRPRRWMTHVVIFIYLGWLGHGVFCHALQYRVAAHPLMYFTVWDMFCGWSGWSFRTHVVAEAESGQFYELTPTPWGEYHAYGNLSREHYDNFANHAHRIGLNCLKQTVHEPVTRMYVIEETWSKKFNLPDPLWKQIHDEPKQSKTYYNVNAVYQPDGTLLSLRPSFRESHQASWLAASLHGQKGRARQQMLLGSTFGN